jgi:hypothetical protein
MKHKKSKIFTDFGTGMSFKNFVINLMKWNQRCYIFTKGPIFLLSGRIFGPFWRKIVWKELATTLAAGDD